MRIEDEKNILERIFYEEESKDLYDLLKRILGLDENGYPNVVNGKILFFAWKRCQKISVELELEAMNERYIDKSEGKCSCIVETLANVIADIRRKVSKIKRHRASQQTLIRYL